jgi:Tol biopolymer transport system component
MKSHDRPGGHSDVTFGISPSGDAVVFNASGKGGRDLYLLDINKRQVTQIAATPDYEVDPQFSPDGESVVYAEGPRFPGDDGPRFPGGGCFKSSYTPDGRRILFFLEVWPDGPSGNGKETLSEVDLKRGNLRQIADYGLFDDPLNWQTR